MQFHNFAFSITFNCAETSFVILVLIIQKSSQIGCKLWICYTSNFVQFDVTYDKALLCYCYNSTAQDLVIDDSASIY